MRFERLLHVVQRIDLARIIKVVHAKKALHLRYPAFGERHGAAFFVNGVITLGVDGRAIFLRWIALDDGASL